MHCTVTLYSALADKTAYCKHKHAQYHQAARQIILAFTLYVSVQHTLVISVWLQPFIVELVRLYCLLHSNPFTSERRFFCFDFVLKNHCDSQKFCLTALQTISISNAFSTWFPSRYINSVKSRWKKNKTKKLVYLTTEKDTSPHNYMIQLNKRK